MIPDTAPHAPTRGDLGLASCTGCPSHHIAVSAQIWRPTSEMPTIRQLRQHRLGRLTARMPAGELTLKRRSIIDGR